MCLGTQTDLVATGQCMSPMLTVVVQHADSVHWSFIKIRMSVIGKSMSVFGKEGVNWWAGLPQS